MAKEVSVAGGPTGQVASAVRTHWRLLVGLGLAVVVLWILWSAKHLGVNIDHLFDQQSFLNMYAEGTGSERWGLYPLEESYRPTEESYGYTFHALAFAVSWVLSPLLGREFEPLSIATFTDKNVLVAMTGVLAVWALYRLALSLTGRRLVAVASALALALIPAFSGHALMNQKDIPLAAGLTCLTAGTVSLVNWLRSTGDPSALRRRHGPPWLVGVLLAVGILLGVGSRPQVAITAGAALVFAIGVGWWFRSNRRHELWAWAIGGVAIGTLVVLATNPVSLPNPVAWVLNAVEVARDFQFWSGNVLVAGEYYTSDEIPWWYLPYMFIVQTPVVVLGAVGLGVASAVGMAVRSRHRVQASLPWVPVGLQVFPAVVGVVGGSLFYNATRQVLFVLPVVALLAGMGVAWLWDRIRTWKYQPVVLVVVAILIAIPVVDTIRLFPYQYVYYNQLGRSGDIKGYQELDYWGISGREVMDWVNETSPSAAVGAPTYWMYQPFGGPDVAIVDGNYDDRLVAWKRLNSNRPNFRTWDDAAGRDLLWTGNYYPSFGMDRVQACPVVHEVTRPLGTQDVLLSYARRCPPGGP